MSDYSEQRPKIELPVGHYDSKGAFIGRSIRFEAEEVGSWTDRYISAPSGYDWGTTYTLYRLSGVGYRIYEHKWSNLSGGASEAYLHPVAQRDEHTHPHWLIDEYGAYTEEEVRREWGRFFTALEEQGRRINTSEGKGGDTERRSWWQRMFGA
jgi:hypothetical protein